MLEYADELRVERSLLEAPEAIQTMTHEVVPVGDRNQLLTLEREQQQLLELSLRSRAKFLPQAAQGLFEFFVDRAHRKRFTSSDVPANDRSGWFLSMVAKSDTSPKPSF